MTHSPDVVARYRACRDQGGIYRRQDRGLIEVTGGDRTAWLNNLVTNVLNTLGPGEGNYAFATNRQGRVVFDANILVLEDRLYLDIDRRLINTALDHLRRFLIREDVALADASAGCRRIALLGPRAAEAVEALGFGNAAAMAWLQHVGGEIAGAPVRMMRHDFAGLLGVEFLIHGERAETEETAQSAGAPQAAEARIGAAATGAGLCDVDRNVVEILRIEAGIPASVEDIDAEVVAPETGQIERGISFQKGCYLGQEVIERMRAHGALARRLVGLQLDAATVPAPGSPVFAGGERVGRVTSGCLSEALGAPLCLAYVKTDHAKPGCALAVAGPREGPTNQTRGASPEPDAAGAPARVVPLPVRPAS